MNNHKLYIIGNGFDLHHKLNTSYASFCRYVKKNEKKLYEFMESYYYLDLDEDGLWADFENDLGTFSHRQFFKDYDNSLPITSDKFKPSDLFGVEDELKEISEDMIEKLRAALYGWLTGIKYLTDGISLLPLDCDSKFLSFNYTDTLNKFYSVPRENIIHIHNAIETHADNLIFGHGEKLDGEPLLDKNGDSNRTLYTDAEGASKILLAVFYKDTKAIIKKYSDFFNCLTNIKEVLVFGHSLNDIDLPYFTQINKIPKSPKWVVSYYDDHELNKMRQALSRAGITTEPSFIKLCDISL